jgi:hypothetical protein
MDEALQKLPPPQPANPDVNCGDSWVRKLNPFSKEKPCS